MESYLTLNERKESKDENLILSLNSALPRFELLFPPSISNSPTWLPSLALERIRVLRVSSALVPLVGLMSALVGRGD